MRADRFHSIEPAEGFERLPHVPLEDWINEDESRAGEMLELRAYVGERAMKSFELTTLFGRIEPDSSGGGVIDTKIPSSAIDFYAARLLSLGTDVRIESPPEIIEAIREKIQAIARLYYPQDTNPEAEVSKQR